MELQICLLLMWLLVCGADIRRAGWLDKVVAHWKKSFVDEFEQLGPINLDASIEPAPPGYKDSPGWDFESVSRMLNLLSISETGQPALNSLRRMIAPTRRMMMDVPGLAVDLIPQSLNTRRVNYRPGANERRIRNRKRTGNNRLGTNIRKGMANNRMGMMNNRMGMANKRMGMTNDRMGMANSRMGLTNNRMGMANKRMGMTNNRMGMTNNRMGMTNNRVGSRSWAGNDKISRKQMLVKVAKEKQLSDFQMSFRLFPSIQDKIPNDIYYDGERDSYEDVSQEYEFVDPNFKPSEDSAIVMLRNPVEARLPSARISVKLLKEILEARAVAARIMPPKKTTAFSWSPMDITTSLSNDGSGDNSTGTDSATGGPDDGAKTDSGGGGPTGAGGDATTPAGGDAPTNAAEENKPDEAPPEERRKMAAKNSKMAVKTSNMAAKTSKVAATR